MRRNDRGKIVGSPNSIERKVTGAKKSQSKRWKRRSRSCIARTFTFLRLVWLYRAGWWSKVQRVSSLVSCIRRCKRDTHHTHNCSFVSQLFVKAHVRWSRVYPASVLLFLFWLFPLLSLSFCLSFISLVLSGASRLAPHGCPHPEFRVNRH